jgi:hypothetical protein
MLKTMRKIAILFTFILALYLHAQTPQNKSNAIKKVTLSKFIIGKWQTVQNSMTTSYLTLEFKKNKEFEYILRSKWTATYQLMNNGMLITKTALPIMNKTVIDTLFVNLKDDNLIIKTKNDNKFVDYTFQREKINESKNTGIVGEWYSQNYAGKPTNLSITQNGEYNISSILKTIKGTYVVKGSHFIVNQGKTKIMDMKFQKFNDDIIVYGNGPNMHLKRVE